MSEQEHHPAADDGHQHGYEGHHHGHENDRGLKGALRYLRFAPRMWRSEINDAVVDMIAPTKTDRLVDIGSGMGAGVVVAAGSGARVVAVEPTRFLRFVLIGRRWLQRARKRISVVDGSAERLPVADEAASAVMAVNTMHHWVDAEAGVCEIARVLGPGGRVVLVDEDFTDPAHPDHDRFGDRSGPERHGFTLVEAEQMGRLLDRAGLAEVVSKKRTVADRPSIVVTASAPSTEAGGPSGVGRADRAG